MAALPDIFMNPRPGSLLLWGSSLLLGVSSSEIETPLDPSLERRIGLDPRGFDEHIAQESLACEPHGSYVGHGQVSLTGLRTHPDKQAGVIHAEAHLAIDHETQAADHALFGYVLATREEMAEPQFQLFIHRSSLVAFAQYLLIQQ